MNIRINIAILLLGFILFSCSKNDRYENSYTFRYEDFKAEKRLTGSVLGGDTLVMKPSEIQIYDHYLITLERGEEKFFQIFDLNASRKIGERIMKGQGPDDMVMPYLCCDESEYIAICDMSTSTVYKYDIEEFVDNITPVPLERIKLENQVYNSVVRLNDYVIGDSYNFQYQLSVFDVLGKKINEIIEYPASSITYSDVEKKDAYYMNLGTDGKERIVLCYCLTDLIEIYDTNGVLQNRIHGPQQFFSHFEQHLTKDIIASFPVKGMNRDAYFSPKSVGDDFFVMYNGRYVDEEDHSSSCNQLFSFSWNGEPKEIYFLDRDILSYTVDKKNRKIYAISADPEYHIVEFLY